MGISVVAAAAACRAGVAFAMIRSTFLETKLLTMVAQAGMSLEAFCSSNSTLSPRAATSASLKPLVASSRAGCCTNWQMPTTNLSFFAPQAAKVRTMETTSNKAISFFIFHLSLFFGFFHEKAGCLYSSAFSKNVNRFLCIFTTFFKI